MVAIDEVEAEKDLNLIWIRNLLIQMAYPILRVDPGKHDLYKLTIPQFDFNNTDRPKRAKRKSDADIIKGIWGNAKK